MTPADRKIRLAIIKFGGMGIGGSELRLQIIAKHLPKDQFDVDYYYCDSAPYIGSDYKHGDTDPERVRYLQDSGVRLIKFHVAAKDITKPAHDWVGTDFWEVFDPKKYDLVQTCKAGHQEYPFHLIPLPVVEIVALAWGGVDNSPNIAWSIQPSPWQWAEWYRNGGRLERVSVIPNPAFPPKTAEDFREELGIPKDHIVAGLIQRDDNNIFSPIPLEAFRETERSDRHFVLMNGGSKYRDQAKELGIRNFHHIPKSGQDITVSKFFNSLDFFAHGRSDGETYGTVFAEALMHGKPCLSHYVAGAGNAQHETMGPCGLFARDLTDYMAKMERLFTDRNLRERFAAKTRIHATQYFSIERGMEDLIDVYRWVLSKDGPTMRTRTSYGLSPLGFHYAGAIGTPGSLANHVITRQVAEEPYIDLIRFFLPEMKGLIDFAADSGLYGLVAAHEGRPDLRVIMVGANQESCTSIAQTVWLNNWEGRVKVITAINEVPDWEADLIINPTIEQSMEIIERQKPVLLFETARSNSVATLDWLARHGYLTLRCTKSGLLKKIGPGTEFCLALHSSKHRSHIRPLFQWTRQQMWKRRWRLMRHIGHRSVAAVRHPYQTIRGLPKYLKRISW